MKKQLIDTALCASFVWLMKTIITEVMKTSWFSRDSARGPLNLENVGFQGMWGVPDLNRNNTSIFDLYHIRGVGGRRGRP